MIEDIERDSNSYLSFKLGNELFAAHVSTVLNILELTPITKVPRTADYMLGVTNLRGSVLPVIDARIKFGIEAKPYTSLTCIIVMDILIEDEYVHIGALVDAVQEVLERDESKILPPPTIGGKYKSEYVKGMVNSDQGFIMVLDMNKVFSTEELLSLGKINK